VTNGGRVCGGQCGRTLSVAESSHVLAGLRSMAKRAGQLLPHEQGRGRAVSRQGLWRRHHLSPVRVGWKSTTACSAGPQPLPLPPTTTSQSSSTSSRPNKRYICSLHVYCQREFSKSYNLLIHERAHTPTNGLTRATFAAELSADKTT